MKKKDVNTLKGTLKELMLPAPVSGGFKMDGYWVWCGSVIHGEDNKYHMFASRWEKDVPMHPGWLIKSEIERATHKSVTSYTQIVYKLNNPFCKYSLSNGYSQCFAK